MKLTVTIRHVGSAARLYGRVRHDYEVFGVSRPEYNGVGARGLPETVKLMNSQFMNLTKEWQLALRDRLKAVCLAHGLADNADTNGFVRSAFRQLLSDHLAFSNGKGSEGHADYVNGTNLDQAPIATETIVTGGAYLEVLEGGKVHNIRGHDCFAVFTLDGNQSPPPVSDFHPFFQDPTTFFATNSVRTALPDGTRVVERFPQLDGLDVPFFVMGNGNVNYIPVERLELLPAGAPAAWPLNPYGNRPLASGLYYERKVILAPRRVVTHIVRIDLAKATRLFVTPKPTKATTPSEWIAAYHPVILINGDEHTYPGGGFVPIVKGRAMSDGVKYSTANTETTLSIGRSDYAHKTVVQWDYPTWAYNAVSGSHELVRAGLIPSGLDNVSLDPRSVVGLTSDGWMLVVASEGRQVNNLGLSMKETADFMKSLGAVAALNLDGGKDTMLWVKDLGFVNDLSGGEQGIANAFLLWI